MKKITQNTFNDGLNMDLNPVVTPSNVLTKCTNGTLITFNGDEFVLQNDMGNVRLDKCTLPKDFVPLGVKEYGGIVYIVSHNPITGESEIGSFPSPEVVVSADYSGLNTGVNIDLMDFYNESEFDEDISVRKNFGLTKDDIIKVGDKFVVYINQGDTNSVFESLVSKYSELNNSTTSPSGKLFKLDLVRISESGNITTLTNNVKSDNNGNFYFEKDNKINLTDDYYYSLFNDNTNGYLAILITIEKLSELTIDSYSVKSNIEGRFDIKFTISDSVKDNHYNKLMGCKVEYTRNSSPVQTIDLEINASEMITVDGIDGQIPDPTKQHIISYSLNDFYNDDVVLLKLTPYTAFGYLTKYSYEKELTSLSTPEIGNVFRYRTDITNDNENLGVVNLNFEVPRFSNDDGILDSDSVFIEFYDVWSDCSMIKEVSIATIQNITIPLCKYDFLKESSDTRYGIPKTELVQFQNTESMYSLLQKSETKYKYRNESLRLNALYIVNIISKKDSYTDLVSTHTLYTNGVFNNEYDLGVVSVFDSMKFKYNTSYTTEKVLNHNEYTLSDNFESKASYFWDMVDSGIKSVKLRDSSKATLKLNVNNVSLFNLCGNEFSISDNNITNNTKLSDGVTSNTIDVSTDLNSISIISSIITSRDRESLTSPEKDLISGVGYEAVKAYTNDFNSEFYDRLLYLDRAESWNFKPYKSICVGMLKYGENYVQPFNSSNVVNNSYRPSFVNDSNIIHDNYVGYVVGEDPSENIRGILSLTDSDGRSPNQYRFIPYILGVTNDFLDRTDGCSESYVIDSYGRKTIISKSDSNYSYPDRVIIGILMRNENGSYSALNTYYYSFGGTHKYASYYCEALRELKRGLMSSLSYPVRYNRVPGDKNIYYSILNTQKIGAIYATSKLESDLNISMTMKYSMINGDNIITSDNISNYINSLVTYDTTNSYRFYNNLGDLTISDVRIQSEFELPFDKDAIFKGIYNSKEQDAIDTLSSTGSYDTTKVYKNGAPVTDVVFKDNNLLAATSTSYVSINHRNKDNYLANLFPIVRNSSNGIVDEGIYNKQITSI